MSQNTEAEKSETYISVKDKEQIVYQLELLGTYKGKEDSESHVQSKLTLCQGRTAAT